MVRGNALLFVLIGIALFSALTFTISRGLRGGVDQSQNAALAAQQILTYALDLEADDSRAPDPGYTLDDGVLQKDGIPPETCAALNHLAPKSCAEGVFTRRVRDAAGPRSHP